MNFLIDEFAYNPAEQGNANPDNARTFNEASNSWKYKPVIHDNEWTFDEASKSWYHKSSQI